MKQLILILGSLLFLASCSKRPVDKLFTHYKQDDKVIAATLPGWLVEKGLKMAFDDADDAESLNAFKSVIKDVDKLRVLISTDTKPNPQIENLTKNMESAKYELYGMVNNKDNKINLWVKEKKDLVKDVFVFITNDDNVVLLQLKGDIDMNALQKVDLNKSITKGKSALKAGA